MKYLLLSLILALAGNLLAADDSADATAKFLAGLPLGGTSLESRSLDPSWTNHAAEFDRAWTHVEKDQLAKIRDWAPAFLGEAYNSGEPMFYMFSGPDFLYAHAFFPNARTYVLCGAEPVGAIPDLDKIPQAALGPALANLRKTLETSLNWSFFITKNLKVDLEQPHLGGTLPVLYVFLARAGCRIESVELMTLDNEGNPGNDRKSKTPGVEIKFIGPSGNQQTLFYFATDLADDHMKANPGLLKFCAAQGRGPSLLKAASYLLHHEYFSRVRDFLLTNSTLILQDDSGIPYRFFTNEGWDVRFAGRYFRPTDTFKEFPQPDLYQAYAGNARASLDFGFGYQWQPNRSSLILATRR